jgi:hypothetical protein
MEGPARAQRLPYGRHGRRKIFGTVNCAFCQTCVNFDVAGAKIKSRRRVAGTLQLLRSININGLHD